MGYSPFIVYVDESGDQGLENFDPGYPIFSLCAAIYKRDDYLKFDLPALTDIKFRHWWHDAVIFHSHKIRQKAYPFQSLKDPDCFDAFITSVTQFFRHSKTTFIAAAIDKPRHKAQYVRPADPYELSIKFVLERTYGHIWQRCAYGEKTMFVFEKRGRVEDNRTQQRFEKIAAGENYHQRQLPFLISFAAKEENIAGLQVADLAAYSVAKFVETGRRDRRDWASIKHLFRTSPQGRLEGWGLKVFP